MCRTDTDFYSTFTFLVFEKLSTFSLRAFACLRSLLDPTIIGILIRDMILLLNLLLNKLYLRFY